QQASVRNFVEAMAKGVVTAQSKSAELLGDVGLQARVITGCIGLKLVDAAKSLIERLLVGIGSKAPVAYILVAVQLNLVRLMDTARSHIVHPHCAMRAGLLLDAKTVLIVVRRLQNAA